MSLLNSIYTQIESIPDQYLSTSCFILTIHDLKTVRIELPIHLSFDFSSPFKSGSLLGFPVYLDPSRSESVFGDPRFYDIDPNSLVVLEI